VSNTDGLVHPVNVFYGKHIAVTYRYLQAKWELYCKDPLSADILSSIMLPYCIRPWILDFDIDDGFDWQNFMTSSSDIVCNR